MKQTITRAGTRCHLQPYTVPFIESFADELEVENEATLVLLYKVIEKSIQINYWSRKFAKKLIDCRLIEDNLKIVDASNFYKTCTNLTNLTNRWIIFFQLNQSINVHGHSINGKFEGRVYDAQ